MHARLIPLALMMAAPAAAAEPEATMPAWMAGCWVEQTTVSKTEECWMGPRGGTMLGASRSGPGDRIISSENLRIDVVIAGNKTSMTYSAAIKDGWTHFHWSPNADPGVTFVNPAHDYPQRIRYWREGGSLLAEIAMIDGSKARRWTYVRQGM